MRRSSRSASASASLRTTTMSGIVDLAPPAARGTALSLRITGNRVGQVLVPFLASLIAVAAGTAGILLVIAFTLAASGTAVRGGRESGGARGGGEHLFPGLCAVTRVFHAPLT